MIHQSATIYDHALLKSQRRQNGTNTSHSGTNAQNLKLLRLDPDVLPLIMAAIGWGNLATRQ